MFWYGNDLNYADSRIRNTIVKTPDQPLLVERFAEQEDDAGNVKRLALGFGLDSEDLVSVPTDDIDLTPFRLGYVNKYSRAIYIVKVPKRQDWRQGLRLEQLQSLSGVAIKYLNNRDLRHMLMNKYPTLDECVLKLEEALAEGNHTNVGFAWHYDWALLEGFKVQYRGNRIVGQLVNNQVILDDQYTYLREALEAMR